MEDESSGSSLHKKCPLKAIFPLCQKRSLHASEGGETSPFLCADVGDGDPSAGTVVRQFPLAIATQFEVRRRSGARRRRRGHGQWGRQRAAELRGGGKELEAEIAMITREKGKWRREGGREGGTGGRRRTRQSGHLAPSPPPSLTRRQNRRQFSPKKRPPFQPPLSPFSLQFGDGLCPFHFPLSFSPTTLFHSAHSSHFAPPPTRGLFPLHRFFFSGAPFPSSVVASSLAGELEGAKELDLYRRDSDRGGPGKEMKILCRLG